MVTVPDAEVGEPKAPATAQVFVPTAEDENATASWLPLSGTAGSSVFRILPVRAAWQPAPWMTHGALMDVTAPSSILNSIVGSASAAIAGSRPVGKDTGPCHDPS